VVLQLPKKNREVVVGSQRWSTVARGCRGSGCNGERATERDTKWRGLARVVVALAEGGRSWPEVVDGGRRVWWQWVQRREREWKELQRRWCGEEEEFTNFEP